MDEAAGYRNEHWRRDLRTHPQLDDYWDPCRYQQRIERVDVPVLHITGWYDDEQIGTPQNFIADDGRRREREDRASAVALIGPWDHQLTTLRERKLGQVDFGPGAEIDLRGFELEWLDRWLLRRRCSRRHEPPVRIFVMGAKRVA